MGSQSLVLIFFILSIVKVFMIIIDILIFESGIKGYAHQRIEEKLFHVLLSVEEYYSKFLVREEGGCYFPGGWNGRILRLKRRFLTLVTGLLHIQFYTTLLVSKNIKCVLMNYFVGSTMETLLSKWFLYKQAATGSRFLQWRYR